VTATRQPLCPKCQSTELDKLFSTFATHGSTRTEGGGAAASRFT
jgi:hypothetical protein